MKKETTAFGERLRAIREASGFTQAQLAEKAGMNPFGIAKLEQGVSEPHWPTVLKLCEALGCTPNDFRAATEGQTTEAKRPGRPAKGTGDGADLADAGEATKPKRGKKSK